MRRRVIEPPLGSKIGYHELEDDKEDADEEWMTGEASQVSGGGSRGSTNWVLKVMFPILVRGREGGFPMFHRVEVLLLLRFFFLRNTTHLFLSTGKTFFLAVSPR